MMGWGTPGYGTDQKFLDETTDLRKESNNKRLGYFEAKRDPETTTETLAKLEQEIHKFQEKIYEQAPRIAYRGYGGYGHCF